MASNKPDVYRGGRRGWRGLWRTLLFLLVFLLLAAVVLVIGFHKYIVYDQDGLRVQFPMFGEFVPAEEDLGPTPTVYPAELVYEEPDYDSLLSTAGQNLEPLRGKYLTAGSISPESLRAAAEQMAAAKGNALVLQMKQPSGSLTWKSGVTMAESFEVNGTAELGETLRELKAEYGDLRLVAVVSCCVDSLMAQRYAAMALKTASGDPYEDGAGGWVDPYNTSLREYLGSLCRELADLGFDEILFSYLQMPNTSAELSYSAQLSTEPTARDAVMSLAQYLRTALSDRHVELGAIISADAALQNAGEGIGQDLTLFAKIFSRICAFADGDTLPTLKERVSAVSDSFDLETRFVPFVRNAQIEGSWVMTG